MRVMLTIVKVFIILFLLWLWEMGRLGSFQNRSASSSFKLVSKYTLYLDKLRRTRRTFLKGARRGDCIVRVSLKRFSCCKRWKKSLILWNLKQSHPSLAVLITTGHGFLKFADRFQDLSRRSCCQKGESLIIT